MTSEVKHSVIFKNMTFQDIGMYRLKVSFYVTLGGTMSMMTNFNKLDFNISVIGSTYFETVVKVPEHSIVYCHRNLS